ncbi:MAG: S41 family peptidase [Lentimicrobiaceae bacterium]|nr:S41 family peptidase [Lentimicrobiaceae bacterium]
MRKRFFSKVKVGVCLLFFAGFCVQSHGQYFNNTPPKEQTYIDVYNQQMQKINHLFLIIRNLYVDTVDFSKLVEKGTVEMLKELDPHSVYIPKEEVAKTNEPLQGNFEGIGVQFQIVKDTVVVVQPIKGGPSEMVGIVAGDKIVQIDDSLAVGKICTNAWVFSKLRGKKGTKVMVKVKRGNNPELYTFTIIRDKIPIHSIENYFMIDEENGYIKLERFSQTTTQEFVTAMRELKMLGMKNLLFDLRGNTGGYLHTAVELVDEFMPAKKLVVYTFNSNMDKRKIPYNTSKEGLFEEGKIVVLIDEHSASASEIVSGALQDWDRAIIVGRRSFGKGLVQNQMMLPDSSNIRLTVSRYYIPSGRCIQKPYEGIEDYGRDLIKRYNSGELTHADSTHFPDSLKYYTDKKRVVYGGGGIMPDIFIPMDTVRVSDYYWKLYRNNIFSQFVLRYLDENKALILKEYPTFEQFNENYRMDEPMWQSFYDFAKEEGVSDSVGFDFKAYLDGFSAKNKDTLNKLFPSVEALQKDDAFEQMLSSYISSEIEKYDKIQQGFDTKLHIERQIRTTIARNLYDSNKSAKVWLELDETYLRAIEVLNDTRLFEKMKITY